MKFNKNQELAIQTIDKNVCLIAGAGTGKTAVLTHRFINIIQKSKLSPLDAMESILAITFTEKATQEMISRVGKLIKEHETSNPDFKELENYVQFANISTIDSFCMGIIQENNLKIGLNPNLTIMPDYEANMILTDVISEVLNERLVSETKIIEIMESTMKNRVKDLIYIFRGAYDHIIKKGYDFDLLLEKTLEFYSVKEVKAADFNLFLEKIVNFVEELQNKKIIDGRNKTIINFSKNTKEIIEKNVNLDLIEKIIRCVQFKEILLNLSKVTPEILNPMIYEIDEMRFLYETKALDLDIYREIISILKDIDLRFRKHKLKEGKLQYSDLIYYALKILEDDDIRREAQNRYKYIMVDEFQDTNYYQKKLIYFLCTDKSMLDRNNLFVVGDPKQSIYGFRGSDLRVFNETIEDIKSVDGEVIILDENYRSSNELVEFANLLFGELMGDKYSELKANSSYLNVPVEILKPDNEDIDVPEIIARRVISLVNSGFNYGDIAILFRNYNKVGQLEEVFSKYAIPFINPKSRSFFIKREIKDLILFLKFIDTPEDDESLYGLLRSIFFMLEDDLIFMLKKSGEKYLYENLINYSGENDKIIYAKNILENVLNYSNEVNISDLLHNFITETSYYELLAVTKSTPQAIENVRKFEDIVLDFTSNYSGFINQFLDYYDSISDENENEAYVDLGDEAVKFMSIHASKGLEFPVVILYDSGATEKLDASKIKISPDHGLAIDFEYKSLLNEKIVEILKEESEEETNRLLYVAFTRAKKQFIVSHPLTVSKNKNDKSKKTHYFDKITTQNYDYDEIDSLEHIEEIKPKLKSILSNESEIVRFDKVKNEENFQVTSSISAYSVFKRCKREYFYNYKLNLHDMEFLVGDESDIVEIEEETYFVPGAIIGTIVHELISENDVENFDDEIIKNALINKGYDGDSYSINTIKELLINYKAIHFKGKKANEFGFMLKLENGKIAGSIDEIRYLDSGEIHIIDYKTNTVRDIEKLIEAYEPQILLYSLAIHGIYNKYPEKSSLYFLKSDDLVDIEVNDEKIMKLSNELNSFLSFISENDNIDKYTYGEECSEYCKYIEICDRNK